MLNVFPVQLYHILISGGEKEGGGLWCGSADDETRLTDFTG